jgi:putative glutamine amidotransferase
MLIALSMRITEASSYVERRDSISHDWMVRLNEWDMTPLLLPNIGNPASLMRRFKPDLLILTGGDDIGVTAERDATELELLRLAVEMEVPVLGVCRGLLLINTFKGGGSLSISGHVAKPHAVHISQEWQQIYGQSVNVNSYHSNAIPADKLADGLRATALDDAGNVEAFVSPDLSMAAVMWHPERAGAPHADRKMIDYLTNPLRHQRG